MRILKLVSKVLCAIFFIGAGVTHFTNFEFFHKIVPPYLPMKEAIVYVSGICEIGLGLGLLIPATSRWAAWGLIALLVAVFPANIYVYQNQDLIPASPTFHLIRLPLQGVLILWAWWHTRPDRPAAPAASTAEAGGAS